VAVVLEGLGGATVVPLDISGQDSDLDCLKREPACRADDETNDVFTTVQILKG